MKVLPAGLQEHLDGGATTLCWCWKLSDATGRVLGFTDHDRDLVVDGLRYEASAGFTASEMQASLGLGVDNLEIAGALRSDRLSRLRSRGRPLRRRHARGLARQLARHRSARC